MITIGRHTLHCVDCMELLRSLPDNSIDAIGTDPSYGLSPDGKARTWDDIEALRLAGKATPKAGFMGKEWDAGVPGITWARECLRVLKPGGHLVAFSATRTVHRLACAVEDAGFEIRDQLHWLHYQGFPKSHNVSKAIDRMKFDREQILQVTKWIASARDAAGIRNADIDNAFGFTGMSGHWTSQKSQPAVPTLEQIPALLAVLKVDDPPEEIRRLLLDLNAAKGEPGPNWWKREITGTDTKARSTSGASALPTMGGVVEYKTWDLTTAATDDAKRYAGFGTALKPAIEPAVFARKPLSEKTVALNVLKWGTGALNIDAGRHADGDKAWPGPYGNTTSVYSGAKGAEQAKYGAGTVYGNSDKYQWDMHTQGKWPANVYHATKPATSERNLGCNDLPTEDGFETTGRVQGSAGSKHARAGRTADNMGNPHPTVKPRKLMAQILRLITPPGGTVLEPFGGSGTTAVAAPPGVKVIIAELSPAYCDIIRARVGHAVEIPSAKQP